MNDYLTAFLVIATAAALSWPLGRYLAWAMDPTPNPAPLRRRLDSWMMALGGTFTREQQDWKNYCVALLVANGVMFTVVTLLLAIQPILPLNPDARGPIEGSLIFNTAASFVTNTNLQHYSGEVSMSYFSQIFALMWLQFVSAATGLAALAALARGLSGRVQMGNFLLDVMRATFLVLLPLALILAFLLVLSGVPMTLEGAATVTTLEGVSQTIARGPVAAFVAIKQLGTNGGGFFGPNSTHPFENPAFLSNLFEMIAILAVPMAVVWMFGRVTGRPRHALAVFGVMVVLLVAKLAWAFVFEAAPTQAFEDQAIVQTVGNLEGKELRLGAATGPLWAVLTTATSNGSVGAMHDSLNPLTGLAPMAGMWLNETFGGVGVGMINMFIYIVIAVFLAGMMVGRTPEYFNRRVEAREMKLAVIALLAHPFFILGGTAIFSVTSWGTDALNNPGAHGFSEILYEFSSAAANNGSGFEGLGDNTVPWNFATGIVMLLARFIPIILPLAIAGSLAAKKPVAESVGTLDTGDLTFAAMLLATIVFIGALTFFPVAALGPIAEHLTFMR